MVRMVRALLAFGVLVALPTTLPQGPAAAEDSAGAVHTPPPPYVGEEATDYVNKYKAGQMDATTTQEARVLLAVDSYYRLKYEAVRSLKVYDLGFLIDCDHPTGLELYNYEMGRLEFSVAAWRQERLSIEDIDYRPDYRSVSVSATSATVTLCPTAFVSSSRSYVIGSEEHVVRLTLTGEGWKLVDEGYDDDFRRLYPSGTHFGALIKVLPGEGEGPSPGGPPPEDTAPQPSGAGLTVKALLALLIVAVPVLAVIAWRAVRGRERGSRRA